jgi:uncharacterized membrane protein
VKTLAQPTSPKGAQSVLTPTHLSLRHLAVLCLILAVGGIVRFFHIAQTSLWMDEVWAIEMSVGHGSVHDHLAPDVVHTDQPDLTTLNNAAPWWQIWNQMDGVTAPPLYNIALRWWMNLFGPSPAATRSLSAIFSLLSILLFYDVCRHLHGDRVALWAAAMIALADTNVDYAQLTRNYAMVLFLALACADLVVRIQYLGASWPRLVSLAILLPAAILTHYFAAGAAIALALYTVLRIRGRDRLKTLASFAVAVAFGFLVWGKLFIRQMNSLSKFVPHYLQAYDNPINRTAHSLLMLPARFVLGEWFAFRVSMLLVIAIAVVAIVIPLARLRWRPDLTLWVLWLIGTVGLIASVDVANNWFATGIIRFTLLATPAVYAILASVNWPRWPAARDAVPLVAVLLMLAVAGRRVAKGAIVYQDVRQYARVLDQNAGPNDLLVFYGNNLWLSPGFDYLHLKYYAPQSRRPWLILHRPATPAVSAQIKSFDSLWMVSREPVGQASKIIPGWKLVQSIDTQVGSVWHLVPDSAPPAILALNSPPHH